MESINKHTVLKEVRNNGSWTGYIAPNKVNPYHIKNGWNLGTKLQIMADKNIATGEMVYYAFFGENNEPRQTRKLNDVINEIMYYSDSSLGNRVKFWIEN